MEKPYTWFAQVLVDADFEPRSYSGRFMYGKQCLSINLEQYMSPVQAVAQILSTMSQGSDVSQFKSDVGDLADLLADSREDSMGLGTVLYFPKVKWDDSYEDPMAEEEDEDLSDEGDCDDSDDGGALASAGMGTDEDYNPCGMGED